MIKSLRSKPNARTTFVGDSPLRVPQAFCPPFLGDPVLMPWELRRLVARLLSGPAFAAPLSPPGCSARFRDQVASFLEAKVDNIERTRRRLGLPIHPPAGDASRGEGGGDDAMDAEGASASRSASIVPLSAEAGEEPASRRVPREAAEQLAENICGITAKQLKVGSCSDRNEVMTSYDFG